MTTFLAVQCFRCEQLQVTQRRRDKRFHCKLCGARQSVRKVFARSERAAQLRGVVMQLNLARGIAAESFDDQKRAAQLCGGDQDDGHGESDRDDEWRTEDGEAQVQREADTRFPPSARLQSQSRWHALETALNGTRASAAALQHEERSDDDDDDDDDLRRIVTTLADAGSSAERKRGLKRGRKRTSTNTACNKASRAHDGEDGAPQRQRHCTTLPGDEVLQEQVWS